jgi:hypothetical protein
MSVWNISTRTTLPSEVPPASHSFATLSTIASACASGEEENYGCRGSTAALRTSPPLSIAISAEMNSKSPALTACG